MGVEQRVRMRLRGGSHSFVCFERFRNGRWEILRRRELKRYLGTAGYRGEDAERLIGRLVMKKWRKPSEEVA